MTSRSDVKAAPAPQEAAGRVAGASGTVAAAPRTVMLNRHDGPVHQYFGLSYSNFLVLHRSILQNMPLSWQESFVELMSMADDIVAEAVERGALQLADSYVLTACDDRGRFMRDPVPKYDRGRAFIDLAPEVDP